VRDRHCSDHDRPVVHEPEEVKNRNEKKGGTGEDQVQLLGYVVPPARQPSAGTSYEPLVSASLARGERQPAVFDDGTGLEAPLSGHARWRTHPLRKTGS
jgi:hypothetical protein